MNTQHSPFSPRVKRNIALNPKKAAWQTDEQLQASPRCKTTEPQNKIWFVKIRENITLLPRCGPIVAEKLEIE
jgi:hypothetical protein